MVSTLYRPYMGDLISNVCLFPRIKCGRLSIFIMRDVIPLSLCAFLVHICASRSPPRVVLCPASPSISSGFDPDLGSPQISICGESGGTSCFYDLAEWYRLRNLVAERDTSGLRDTYETIATSKTADLFSKSAAKLIRK